MVIGLDREGEEVVDLLKSNLIEISSLSDNQKELYKVLEENDFLKSCYKEIKGIDSVYLHVNSACNLHCLGCYSYVENRNTRNELSFDEWKCVIDDLSLLGVKNIVISGGEPFLRKDLREICKYIKETVNGSLEVISNGTMNISDYEVVLLSDGTLWEGQIALYFRWTCLPDCAVPELDADYRRNNRRLS